MQFFRHRCFETTIYNLRIDSVRTQISPISVMAKLQWKTFEWKNRFTQFLLKLLIVVLKLMDCFDLKWHIKPDLTQVKYHSIAAYMKRIFLRMVRLRNVK